MIEFALLSVEPILQSFRLAVNDRRDNGNTFLLYQDIFKRTERISSFSPLMFIWCLIFEMIEMIDYLLFSSFFSLKAKKRCPM